MAEIYRAKGRPAVNPLIVHVTDLAAAERLADLSPVARALAERFWPGPLTLVLPRRPTARLAPALTAGLSTVALRVPAHAVARALLGGFGAPVAAPSANRSGGVSPTTAAHVDARLGALVLDGGRCAVGVESTILAVDGSGVRLLRTGGVPEEALAIPLEPSGAGPRPEAPGQFASHYAPGAALRLDAAAPGPGEAFLGFGPLPPASGPALTLSATGDLAEAAAQLFAHLRLLDAALGGRGTIAVAPVPDRDLGRAINDRLRRAAAPRGPA